MGRKRSESRVRTGDSHQIWCSVSSTTRSNAKKSSSLVKSTLRPTPRLSTWKTIPPGECRLGRDIHGFLPRYPSFVNLVAVTFSPCADLKGITCEGVARPDDERIQFYVATGVVWGFHGKLSNKERPRSFGRPGEADERCRKQGFRPRDWPSRPASPP